MTAGRVVDVGPSGARRSFCIAGAALLIAICPFVTEGRWLSGSILALILTIGGAGLHFLTGVTGQLSLGHAFFFGIGAVTAAWLGGDRTTGFSTIELWGLGLPMWVWLPAAAFFAGIAGLVVGPSAARLRGLPLGLVTLGLVFLGAHIFSTVEQLSGGVNGRAVPDLSVIGHDFSVDLEIMGLRLDRDRQWFFAVAILAVVALVVMRNLERSRLGCACTAIRDRDVAAAVLGVRVNRTKLVAFVIGSAYAGFAGALYGSYLGRIAGPEQFDLFFSLQFVVIVVVGGLGSRAGMVAGAAFVALVPAAISSFGHLVPFLSPAGSGGLISVQQFSNALFGAALMATLLIEPTGLAGLGRRVRHWAHRWPLRAG